MPYDPLSALPRFFDLLAFVRALSWRLWVLPTRDEPARPGPGWPRIRLSLFAGIAGLTITTPLLLLMRAAEMGRQTLLGAVPLVPRVLRGQSVIHGSVWKVCAAALVVLWLWVLWRETGKGPAARRPARRIHRRLGRRPPGAVPHRARSAYALETAERLSRLAGLALLCVVLTGIYNAVTQIGFPERAVGDRLRVALAVQAGRRARHGGARRHHLISRPASAAGLGPGVTHLPSYSIGR